MQMQVQGWTNLHLFAGLALVIVAATTVMIDFQMWRLVVVTMTLMVAKN